MTRSCWVAAAGQPASNGRPPDAGRPAWVGRLCAVMSGILALVALNRTLRCPISLLTPRRQEQDHLVGRSSANSVSRPLR